jgi:hypothetical protein
MVGCQLLTRDANVVSNKGITAKLGIIINKQLFKSNNISYLINKVRALMVNFAAIKVF